MWTGFARFILLNEKRPNGFSRPRGRLTSKKIKIPNKEFSPSPAPIEFSQLAFPTTVLLNDDRSDFAQEERLDLPLWTLIRAICVVVDEDPFPEDPVGK